jgi:hypothetical protein
MRMGTLQNELKAVTKKLVLQFGQNLEGWD